MRGRPRASHAPERIHRPRRLQRRHCRARVRRAPEAPASRALVGATPPASALPGLPIATGLAPRSAPQFPQLCEDRDPSCGGCLGERGAGTHVTPSPFASAFDVLRRRDEFLGAAGGGLRIRQPVSKPQFCRHRVAGSYHDKKRL